jgi:hypothetical protein
MIFFEKSGVLGRDRWVSFGGGGIKRMLSVM